ncbi:TPA: type II toxin-antitoxin system VapC family toxin [bacterium]|nr:type II toxin-antitoxin system VapC family toxin [bacterium]
MYLVDTSVFLEVLLIQDKRKICKDFLDLNIDNLYISDFSLHSIGVILIRNKKDDVFQRFAVDVIPNIDIITLSKSSYESLVETKIRFGLDFDDTYQYMIAKEYDLEIATLDSDFKKVSDL